MSKITKIFGREILDSRGNPTVEVEVELESGVRATAGVPSGASTGTYEDLELRDGDPNRYNGLGVLNAVKNVNTALQEVIGMETGRQAEIDNFMIKLDGTNNESNLGANAILGVSLAVCRAAALEKKVPLYEHIAQTFKISNKEFRIPVPMFNVLNGGMHSDSGLSIQEFKLIPGGVKTFQAQLRAGSEIFHALRKILISEKYSVGVGDEGGFAPKLESNTQALEVITRAIENAGYKPGKEVFIGLDAAANSFFDKNENKYIFKPENSMLTREMLINIYSDWISKYAILSLEDGLNENDWEGWAIMDKKLAAKVLLIGDDFLVTKVERLKEAIQKVSCNAVLIKVNQAGTLTEAVDCVKVAKENKIKTVISHRSGETTDDFIADLAVGVGADYIKSGSVCRGERVAKYNRLLRIEEGLNYAQS